MGHGRVPGGQVRVDGVEAGFTTTPGAFSEVANEVAADNAGSLLAFLVAHAFGRGGDGVEWLYQLASERMRSKLGDLAVFQRAFRNELYAPLLTHQQLSVVGLTTIGASARAEVVVIGTADEVATYLVALKLSRHGASAGNWQLSGIAREGIDL